MSKKILIFGANGYVGSHIAREALRCGATVVGVCRSGSPPSWAQKEDSWGPKCLWEQADAMNLEQVKGVIEVHPDTAAIISCIGMFGRTTEEMRRGNGTPNVNIALATFLNQSIDKYVLVSAAQEFWPVSRILRGYYVGKRSAEKAMRETLGPRHLILRPGFVCGSRMLHDRAVPLQFLGRPLEAVLGPLHKMLPEYGILQPPISVDVLAKCAVQGALNRSYHGTVNYTDMTKAVQTGEYRSPEVVPPKFQYKKFP